VNADKNLRAKKVNIYFFSSFYSLNESSLPEFFNLHQIYAVAVDDSEKLLKVLSEDYSPGLNLEESFKKLQQKINLVFFQKEFKISTLSSDTEIQKISKRIIALPKTMECSKYTRALNCAQDFFQTQEKLFEAKFPNCLRKSTEVEDHCENYKNFPEAYSKNSKTTQAIKKESTRKKKLLLHICCGPDAAGVLRQLKEEYEVTCFWYDPNIQPKEEYDLRLEAFVKVAEIEKVPYIIGEYDVDYFIDRIKGHEASLEQGSKCSICYDLRLERSAHEAQKQNSELYTTTLAISPHKVQKKLENFGKLYEVKYKVPYLARNFMKDDGFKESVELSKDWDIYRQDYCGCWFSLHEGGKNAQAMAKNYGLEHESIVNKSYTLPEN